MENGKQKIKGSDSRDHFKFMHKQSHPGHYACDLDFVLVRKDPDGIVALLDYKSRLDEVTFSEVVTFNDFINRGIPVYIIVGDAYAGCFEILRYMGGNKLKPRYTLKSLCRTQCWEDFHKWESAIREHLASRFTAEGHTHGR